MSSTSNQDTIERLYIAYYGRPADAAGLTFWADALNRVGGDPTKLINDFGTSPEATQYYAGLTVSQQIDKIYQLMFNRSAESAGLNYWADKVNSGAATTASVMLNILNGAQANDKAIIDNKLAAANILTNDTVSDSAKATWYGQNSSTVRTWLSKIDGSSTAVSNAQSDLTKLYTGTNLYGTGSVTKVSTTLTPTTNSFAWASDPLLKDYIVTTSSVTNKLVDSSGMAVPNDTSLSSNNMTSVLTTATGNLFYDATASIPLTVSINSYKQYNNGQGPYGNLTFIGHDGTSFINGSFGDNVIIGGSNMMHGENVSLNGGHNYVRLNHGGGIIQIFHTNIPGSLYPNGRDLGTTIDLREGGTYLKPNAQNMGYDNLNISGYQNGLDKIILDKSLVSTTATQTYTNYVSQYSQITINSDLYGLVLLKNNNFLSMGPLADTGISIQGNKGVYICTQDTSGGPSPRAYLFYLSPGDTGVTQVAQFQANGVNMNFSTSDFFWA